MPESTTVAVKCACPSCQCKVLPASGIKRDGKIFCSAVCAYDCTDTTCVCVHERCDHRELPRKQ